MSTGGVEPPQLSPHAPQACVSTIPPHRHSGLLNFHGTCYIVCGGCALRPLLKCDI